MVSGSRSVSAASQQRCRIASANLLASARGCHGCHLYAGRQPPEIGSLTLNPERTSAIEPMTGTWKMNVMMYNHIMP